MAPNATLVLVINEIGRIILTADTKLVAASR